MLREVAILEQSAKIVGFIPVFTGKQFIYTIYFISGVQIPESYELIANFPVIALNFPN